MSALRAQRGADFDLDVLVPPEMQDSRDVRLVVRV
jgi:hypothetical protein